jgi:phospholipid/cholesterol/gamma-HCH transport system ATP-binding protein
MIVCRDVDFAYPGGAPVLRGFSLELPAGKVCAIMGASGGGKTTVLRLLGGQHLASRGQVQVFGQDVAQLGDQGLRAMRRRMGVLFQLGALFTDLSVFDNVAFALREHTRLPEPMVRDIVLMKLHAVGLRGARDLMPSDISGGMARRVALARAIALDPELMMYDEPFAGLDPIALGTTARLIRELNDALNMTTVLVSHDVDETFRIADWVVVLAAGAVAAQGTPAQLRASTDPLLQQFLGAHAQGPVPFHYPAPSLAQDFALPGKAAA